MQHCKIFSKKMQKNFALQKNLHTFVLVQIFKPLNLKIMNKDVKQTALDFLDYLHPDSVYGCDLHHEIFNTDYFIIGYYEAEKWLIENPGIFQAIEDIVEYENENFGRVHTDLSRPERVCNMYAYIKGEELLFESKVLQDNWDVKLSQEAIEAIKKELEQL